MVLNLNFIKPNQNLKKERIINACNKAEKTLSKFTHNKTVAGYLVIFLHLTFSIIEASLFILLNLSIINIVLLLSIIIIHGNIHFYYGGNGCIITRIERHMLDNKNWYGIITIFYKIFNIETTDNTQYYSELFITTIWTILIVYFLYRIYTLYFA